MWPISCCGGWNGGKKKFTLMEPALVAYPSLQHQFLKALSATLYRLAVALYRLAGRNTRHAPLRSKPDAKHW